MTELTDCMLRGFCLFRLCCVFLAVPGLLIATRGFLSLWLVGSVVGASGFSCSVLDLGSLTRDGARTLHWKLRVLTAGSPRKFHLIFSLKCY